jgi:glycerol kinase
LAARRKKNNLVAQMTERKLGVVKEIVEEAGMGISHVYEDLVFLDHNAMLLQFTNDSSKLLLRINREADQETAASGAALLKQAALAREMQFMDSGSYALAQDGPEQVRLEFFA